jgi:hypothetical protein
MDFIVKLYQDKPSKIGITYPREYQAVQTYEALYRTETDVRFFLNIEIKKLQLQLTLISEESGVRTVYKELDYKAEQLKKLQEFSFQNKILEFVHIYSKANTFMVAKPFRTARFIRICGIDFIHEN